MRTFWLIPFVLLACAKDNALPEPSSETVTLTHEYPAVVRLGSVGACTGTFITPHTLLTASHCVRNNRLVDVATEKKLFSREIRKLGSGEEDDTKDVALVLFDEEVISKSQVLSVGNGIDIDEEVSLVSYGCSNLTSSRAERSKHFGTNKISSNAEFIELATPLSSFHVVGPKNRAGLCTGDSGGPLLQNGKIIGIAHSVTEEEGLRTSLFVDITRPEIQSFIRQHLR